MFFKDIKAKKLNHRVNENQNCVFTDQIFGMQNDTITKSSSKLEISQFFRQLKY